MPSIVVEEGCDIQKFINSLSWMCGSCQNGECYPNQTWAFVSAVRSKNGALSSRARATLGAILALLSIPGMSWNSFHWAWRQTRARSRFVGRRDVTAFRLPYAASDQTAGPVFGMQQNLCHFSSDTMNEQKAEPIDLLLGYQTQRLKDLIEEILHCCKEQATYLSSKFDIPEAELRCLMLFGSERYLKAFLPGPGNKPCTERPEL